MTAAAANVTADPGAAEGPDARIDWVTTQPGSTWTATFPDHPGFVLALYRRRKPETVYGLDGSGTDLRPGYVATLYDADHKILPLMPGRRANPVRFEKLTKLAEARSRATTLASTYIHGIASSSEIQAGQVAATGTTRSQREAIEACVTRLIFGHWLGSRSRTEHERCITHFKGMLEAQASAVETLFLRFAQDKEAADSAADAHKAAYQEWERSPGSRRHGSVPDGTYSTVKRHQQSFYPGDDPVTYEETVEHTAYRSVPNPGYREPPSLAQVRATARDAEASSRALDAFLRPLAQEADVVTSRALAYERTVAAGVARQQKEARETLLRTAWEKLSPEERDALKSPETTSAGFRQR